MAQYVKAWCDWIEQTSALEDDEKGRLFIAILEYAKSGAIIELPGRENLLLPVFRAQVDRDFEVRDKLAQNGTKGVPKSKARSSKKKQTQAKLSKQKQTKAKSSITKTKKKTKTKTKKKKKTKTKKKTVLCARSAPHHRAPRASSPRLWRRSGPTWPNAIRP